MNYSEHYLDDAMNNLGEAMDYAVNRCHLDAERFLNLFVTSGYAEKFSLGVSKIVSGMSGSELVLHVLEDSGESLVSIPEAGTEYDCSIEFWCGYILAYFQWCTEMSFKDILRLLPFHEIKRMYPALHEASEEKAVDVFSKIIEQRNTTTKLQTIRRNSGMSQRELSKKSGVSLRSIQQYEQRAKNINKASADTLLSLARTLGCRMEDLLEAR